MIDPMSHASDWLDFEDYQIWARTPRLRSYHMQFCLFGGD